MHCRYPQRKPRAQRRSRSNGPSDSDTGESSRNPLPVQQTNDKVAVSGIDSQCSNQQQPGVPTSESGDVITFMGISESTREESNQPHADSRRAAADEEACYPGTPASFVREPSSQYEHTSPTDQEMVDCESGSFQTLPDARVCPRSVCKFPTRATYSASQLLSCASFARLKMKKADSKCCRLDSGTPGYLDAGINLPA